LPEVWLWAGQYLPFERLTRGQQGARAELRRRVRLLHAGDGEILDASYAGPKPTNADVENLVLYNIDTSGGCFRPGASHGVSFEMAPGARHAPLLGDFACSYRYRLVRPGSELACWRTERTLADFADADLRHFPAVRRLEQVWLAIHRAKAVVAGQRIAAGTPFAVFLTLAHPRAMPVAADPELVKALIDGAVAAFQAHGDRATLSEVAHRVATATELAAGTVVAMLADDHRAVLGVPGKLAHLRGSGVQWNPGDRVSMAGQVTCERADQNTWTLAGEIRELRPRGWYGRPASRSRRWPGTWGSTRAPWATG
jgi:hypothetical protein